MQKVKKIIIASALLIALVAHGDTNLSKSDVLYSISRSTTRSSEDMFEQPIDFAPWQHMVNEAQAFVRANAQKDAALSNSLTNLLDLNGQLIVNLANAQSRIEKAPQNRQSYLSKFAAFSKHANDIKTSLTRTSLKNLNSARRDARDVLVELATAISDYATAARAYIMHNTAPQHLTPTLAAPRKALAVKPRPASVPWARSSGSVKTSAANARTRSETRE